MAELTEQQEQELIAAAKAGDPKANYDLSMWALDRAREEPEEERWNRLAAKCLLRSADAGYEPAIQAKEQLLRDMEGGSRQQPQQPRQQEYYDRQPAQGGGLGKKLGGVFAAKKSQPREKSAGGFSLKDIANWDEAKWKKVQNIAIGVCAALALLIVLIIVLSNGSGSKREKNDAAQEVITEPVEATIAPTPTPEPVGYPDEETRAEIAEKKLDVFPEDDDYVDEETVGTVSTGGSNVRMRKGPGTDYDIVKEISNGTDVNVYAEKNDWYLIESSGNWGWASSDYIKLVETTETTDTAEG